MPRVSQILTEEVAESAKKSLKKIGRNGSLARKLQAMIAAKEHGIKKVAEVYNISRTTLTRWINNFKQGSIEMLKPRPKKPRSKVKAIDREVIRSWLERDNSLTIKEVGIRMQEELGITLSKSSIHRLIKKLNFSYITPRPKHYKQDKGQQEEFIKLLTAKLTQTPASELFFFDEARFGTHTKLGYGWFKKGTRSRVKVKIGYQNFYLYAAANSNSGYHIELILPTINTACMNIFLQELGQATTNKKVILIMDSAAWHKSKGLKIPENITIIFLPPYSPELNPIERLWLYIKQHTIKNRIYNSLSALEESVSNFVVNLKPEKISSTCRVNYMSNY